MGSFQLLQIIFLPYEDYIQGAASLRKGLSATGADSIFDGCVYMYGSVVSMLVWMHLSRNEISVLCWVVKSLSAILCVDRCHHYHYHPSQRSSEAMKRSNPLDKT